MLVCRRCCQDISVETMGGYFTCNEACDFNICINCYDIPNNCHPSGGPSENALESESLWEDSLMYIDFPKSAKNN